MVKQKPNKPEEILKELEVESIIYRNDQKKESWKIYKIHTRKPVLQCAIRHELVNQHLRTSQTHYQIILGNSSSLHQRSWSEALTQQSSIKLITNAANKNFYISLLIKENE